jgi:hypothetical protein
MVVTGAGLLTMSCQGLGGEGASGVGTEAGEDVLEPRHWRSQ